MNKFIAFIVIILIALGIIFLLQEKSNAPEIPLSVESALDAVVEGSDTTAVINQDLESVDIGDLDSEFGDIDLDLDTL